MQMNLKTTLVAYPKLSPSILENYVTKEELEAKNYVTDVVEPDPSAIYGRKKVDESTEWVPVDTL